ncbi:MAG TPA: type II toxin-antitoxin system RelE/ParE family toxin [Verrucomicrobiae bacterium]|nr:type II toxin-antitoxin system RelE/ParE family toxin [Verrucomicrobiae bacterium]
MKPVKFHPQAEYELAESVDFDNGRLSGLGDDFFAVVKLAGRQIQSSPLRRPLRRDGTRQIRLPRFPHAIVYRDRPEQIEIVAVAHGARRPGYWRERL